MSVPCSEYTERAGDNSRVVQGNFKDKINYCLLMTGPDPVKIFSYHWVLVRRQAWPVYFFNKNSHLNLIAAKTEQTLFANCWFIQMMKCSHARMSINFAV